MSTPNEFRDIASRLVNDGKLGTSYLDVVRACGKHLRMTRAEANSRLFACDRRTREIARSTHDRIAGSETTAHASRLLDLIADMLVVDPGKLCGMIAIAHRDAVTS